jgi:2-polyprenyl-3-methyl-5-hydroxy-6-metoxy-1,4-benzoquinol methylase
MSSIPQLFKHAIHRGFAPTISIASKRIVHFLRTGYLHTGERVCLDFPNEINEYHQNVYRFLLQFASGKDVLDVGCGTGYGAAILAATAKSVTAIDYSHLAVRYARLHQSASNLSFSVMKADALRFPDQSFDLVMSCEVFEHLPDQDAHLAEVARVMKRNALCFIATPNSELTEGFNSFHIKENNYREMRELLFRHFEKVAILETTLEPPTREQKEQQDARIRAGDVGFIPRPPLSVFGSELETEYLQTRQSFFCFAKRS